MRTTNELYEPHPSSLSLTCELRPHILAQALWASVVLMMAAAGARVVAEDGITVGSVVVVSVLGIGGVLVAVTVQRFRTTFR